jgi:Tol biopolymer transport system component
MLSFWHTEQGSSNDDGWLLKRSGSPGAWTAAPYLNSPASESPTLFSPDGKWACYQSNKSGRYELYVRRFTGSAEADAATPQIQVSTGAGGGFWWSPDGKEIRYADLDDNVMSVKTQLEPTFSAAAPTKLFSIKDLKSLSSWFVADGRMLVTLPGEGDRTTRIDLVLNFGEELKQKMAAAGVK